MLVVAVADAVVKLTRFDAALPFLVAAVLVAVGAVVSVFVTDKVSSVLHGWARDAGQSVKRLPYAFQPEVIARMSTWTIDTAQVVTTILAPLVGLVLLFHQGATGLLALVNVVIFLVAISAFGYFWKKSPDRYAQGWPSVLTPITVLAFGLNVIGGGIAYAIGP